MLPTGPERAAMWQSRFRGQRTPDLLLGAVVRSMRDASYLRSIALPSGQRPRGSPARACVGPDGPLGPAFCQSCPHATNCPHCRRQHAALLALDDLYQKYVAHLAHSSKSLRMQGFCRARSIFRHPVQYRSRRPSGPRMYTYRCNGFHWHVSRGQ